MSAEEEIPESVKSTLDAMNGKEDPWIQNRIALLAVVALVSGWATLQLFVRYAQRDAVSATHYVILFPCGWGFGIFLFASALFRKKRNEPDQSSTAQPIDLAEIADAFTRRGPFSQKRRLGKEGIPP